MSKVDALPVVPMNIKSRVSRSLVALVIRQIIAYGSIFIGNILLSRWLEPGTYGLFVAAIAFQQTLSILSDIGLGAALIQRAENPTDEELTSLFVVQVAIFGTIALAVSLLASPITKVANLGTDGENLIRILAIVFFTTAFRSIPALLLERNLRFDVIALAETISTVIYQVVVISLVAFGFGIASIIWGLGFRYISDLLIIIYFNPWRPQVAFNLNSIKPYLRFGLSMQGVRLLGYTKDSLPILLLVPLLGSTSAGQWGWALSYVGIPVYFNRLVDRIMFPAYSRVQHDPQAIGLLSDTAIWMNFVIGLPILLILVLFAPYIIPLIYGSVWKSTIPIINVLLFNMIGGFIIGIWLPILYSTGKSNKAFWFFFVWVFVTLSGAITGVIVSGLLGMAVGYSLATIIAVLILKPIVQSLAVIKLSKCIKSPVIATLLSGCLGALGLVISVHWIIVIIFTMIIYLGILLYFDYKKIISVIKGSYL